MTKNAKLLLFLGILNIWTGIMLRIFDVHVPSPAWFFALGGSFKITYLVVLYFQGRYKPGYELLYLAGGLLLLRLSYMVKSSHPASVFGTALLVKAIILKVIFLFMVIRNIRALRLQAISQPVAVNDADRAVD